MHLALQSGGGCAELFTSRITDRGPLRSGSACVVVSQGARLSMGSDGDLHNNAACESSPTTLVRELLELESLRTHAEVPLATFGFIEGWYHAHRRNSWATSHRSIPTGGARTHEGLEVRHPVRRGMMSVWIRRFVVEDLISDSTKKVSRMAMDRSPAACKTSLRSALGWLLSLSVATIGCGSASDSPATDDVSADTAFLDPTVTVGLEDGDPNYLFGGVTSVAVDAQGRIYVGDRVGATVRVFDTDGTFLRQLAAEGMGPGEISYQPAFMTFDGEGRLYVRDGVGVTVFATRAGGSLPDSLVATWRTIGLGDPSSVRRDRVVRDGRYYKQGYLIRPGANPRFFYAPFAGGVTSSDTLELPAYPGLTATRPALLRLGTVDRMMLQGLSRVPFAAVPVWDVTRNGTVLSSDGTSLMLIETDRHGDTIRTIQLPDQPLRRVPPGARADSLRALEQRIARVPGRLSNVEGLGEGVAERRLPDFLPRVIGLRVVDDGTIWLEQWPPEDQPDFRHYMVLDESGALLRFVVLRAPLVADPPPHIAERFIVGVIRDPDTEVERVVRFDLPWDPPVVHRLDG